jgi:hypothetical protein
VNDYNQAARLAMKEEPRGQLRWLFPRLPDWLGYRRWLDSQSAPRPGEPDRRCDTIADLGDERGLTARTSRGGGRWPTWLSSSPN